MRWCSGATGPTGGNDEHDDCGDDRAGPRLMYSRARVRLGGVTVRFGRQVKRTPTPLRADL